MSKRPAAAVATESEAEAAQKLADRIAVQELKDFREIWALHSGAGVRFFRRWAPAASVFGTTYTGNAEGYFREGARSIATGLLDRLELACGEEALARVLSRKPQKEDVT